MELIELTDEAIVKLLEKKEKENFKYIRLGITGGGCAGFEYVFDSTTSKNVDDIEIDFGKIHFLIDKLSVPYINGMTLDYRKEGLNEVFKFINPKEEASCGCGVSINFDLEQVEIDKNKIFAIEV
jgi:iron-sulfur cluster assembly accessory protein